MQSRLALVAVLAALVLPATAAAGAAANLPLKDPKGVARVWQANINRNWDPAGRCRVLARYAVRCSFTDDDMRLVQTFSEDAAHKLRVATTVDGVGPIVAVPEPGQGAQAVSLRLGRNRKGICRNRLHRELGEHVQERSGCAATLLPGTPLHRVGPGHERLRTRNSSG
jgi:hypothetical protein